MAAPSADHTNDERLAELKAFDETKAGVKGLVDAGIKTIPRIFLLPAAERDANEGAPDPPALPLLELPVVDISAVVGGGHGDLRRKAVEQIGLASETWGFFQVLGHGVPTEVLEEMLAGIRRFNELGAAEKAAFYTRDPARRVRFNSTFDLFRTRRANWRDSFGCIVAPVPVSLEEIPVTCREIILKYSSHIAKLGETLLELLSEALGLRPSHLKDLGCNRGQIPHSDSGFLTVLLQDDIGGLQVRHQARWVDVPPVPGALVINVGDLIQLITNDRFQSVEHRVLASRRGPRISVATFFTTNDDSSSTTVYGPIKELLSEDNPQFIEKLWSAITPNTSIEKASREKWPSLISSAFQIRQ
ncbi:unnamed protein product [Spirodela intermedia]|uniref:Fe2OG dioxygenase domain-containing protein n=1 Tax=Spirodela intermedia TaxID=51605 RepID=A0A7I8J8X5_SPIIN|nr:unnamed protein product [Spirodela intermedia]CAA6666544.1 unnamed protein product [Spirodela intermedia]